MMLGEALIVFLNLSKAFRELSELTVNARAEGRKLSPEEIEAVHNKYELSFDNLDAAIKKAEERT